MQSKALGFEHALRARKEGMASLLCSKKRLRLGEEIRLSMTL